ncbi:UNVERIFIED_CONTAM: hypothetical protein GTU68_028957 [Idotea baltica]|nr:hypothetical protein [Idotea baltica]
MRLIMLLAEASNFLVRNVNYEIPSLKKQISKCRQIQEECEKKNSDIIKRSAAAKDKYLSACKKIEISGDNPKEELLSLLDKLPERLSSIGEKAKVLSEARDYYQDFIHFIVSPKQSCLPLLKFLIERGDVTLYEWKYNEPPVSIERKELSFQISKEEESVVSDEIDFGEASIDFGEDVQTRDGRHRLGRLGRQAGCHRSIDFGDDADIGTSEIVVESTGLEGGVAKGPEALSLLFTEETRNQVINELMELEGFLSQRMVELETEENVLSMSLFTNSPRSLQYQSVEGISKHLAVVSEITQDLTSTKMQHLFMIGTSPRYVDRLVESLQRHLRDRDRLLASVEGIKQKSSEASQQQHVLSKHLQLIIARSKELQENVEKLISKKYKDRVVNLMGGIQHI